MKSVVESLHRLWSTGDLSMIPDIYADRQGWRRSTLGHLLRAEPVEIGLMLAWWTGLLLTIGLLITPIAALEFGLLWVVSRATTFHVITIFREISDHVGLRPGTLIGFSRNQIGGGFFGALFHPHNNGYHLLHHLNPGMPYYSLPQAHALLLAWPEYAAGTPCRGYFLGETALVHSWVRARHLNPADAGPRRTENVTSLRPSAARSRRDGLSCRSG